MLDVSVSRREGEPTVVHILRHERLPDVLIELEAAIVLWVDVLLLLAFLFLFALLDFLPEGLFLRVLEGLFGFVVELRLDASRNIQIQVAQELAVIVEHALIDEVAIDGRVYFPIRDVA